MKFYIESIRRFEIASAAPNDCHADRLDEGAQQDRQNPF